MHTSTLCVPMQRPLATTMLHGHEFLSHKLLMVMALISLL
jgi:hypothetical protein